MNRFFRYFLTALLAAFCLCACDKDGKVIPRKKFARIYAEMFLSDAWLTTAPSEARMQADTTAFYEPVFEKYGYTVEDYLASVSYYLQDPDRFSRILKRSGQLLDSEFKAVQAQLEADAVVSVDGTNAEDKVLEDEPVRTRKEGRRKKKGIEEDIQVLEEPHP